MKKNKRTPFTLTQLARRRIDKQAKMFRFTMTPEEKKARLMSLGYKIQ